MEGHDVPDPGNWSPWDDDFENDWSILDPEKTPSTSTPPGLPLDAATLSKTSQMAPNQTLDDFILGLSEEPLDLIGNIDNLTPPSDFPPLAETISPSGSSDVMWSSPGGSAFTGSTPGSDPCLSPELLNLFFDVSQFSADHINNVPYPGEQMIPDQRSTMIPGVQQQPSQQPTTATQAHHTLLEGRPPGMSAREWRRITLPVRCPICDKGHDYKGALDRHIASNHKDRAAELNVSTKRYRCELCGQDFARSYGLSRHRRQTAGACGWAGRRRGRRRRNIQPRGG